MTDAGEANPNFQLYVWSIARNILTNEIGLFGLYGGFATWHTDTGLVVHRSIDPETGMGGMHMLEQPKMVVVGSHYSMILKQPRFQLQSLMKMLQIGKQE